jgi:hypothetical protein
MNIRHYAAATVVAILAWMSTPSSAPAVQLSGVGGRFGSLDPESWDQAMALGAHVEFETAGSRVHLQPGFLYWSSDRLSDFNPNMDVFYHFAPPNQVSPYVGAGVGLHRYVVDGGPDPGTDAGANFVGGLLFPAGSARLFLEGRYAATARDQASILAGITARVGH